MVAKRESEEEKATNEPEERKHCSMSAGSNRFVYLRAVCDIQSSGVKSTVSVSFAHEVPPYVIIKAMNLHSFSHISYLRIHLIQK